jgi:hypothetical protein
VLLPQPSASAKTSAHAAISAKVRAVLLEEASAVAAARKDRHPSDIQVVLVTEVEAQKLEDETRDGVKTVTSPPARALVYFVAMRGSFRVVCKGGPGVQPTTCPPAPVLMARLSASTEKVIGWSVTNHYPDLESVGAPRILKSSRRR